MRTSSRHRSAVFTPASCCFNIPMICSSAYRLFFIPRPPVYITSELQLSLVEFLGGQVNMNYTQMTGQRESPAAFRTVKQVLRAGSRSFSRTVGFQGRSLTQIVYWHNKYGFWSIADPNMTEDRFWIAFGTQDASKYSERTSLSITCETNVPKVGIDGRCGGAFYQKGTRIYLCHNGRVGGGRAGIGKKAFLSWYADRFGITGPPGIIVGELPGSEARFLSETAKFVHAVEQFKGEVKAPRTVDEELDLDADTAQDEGEFDPRGNKSDRERALRSINIRRGQPEFRKKLLKAYSSKCALSGYDCVDALEAAHIRGYWTEDSNHVQNGLLLRGDLHTLFDLGKVGVEPNSFKIIVCEQLMTTLYGKLNGKKIRLPVNQAQWPNSEVLRDHAKRWKLK